MPHHYACRRGAGLKALRLGGNKVSAAGLLKLRAPLATASLRELWLGNNPIGDAGAKLLGTLLPRSLLHTLHRLPSPQRPRQAHTLPQEQQ